ncbi:hypothetical protein [Sedimentitalea sp.]|uniref:hypothetical protein n=1 Tax=Sedimentitalea sp. TaxID=2048915 RepID=UPI003299783A
MISERPLQLRDSRIAVSSAADQPVVKWVEMILGGVVSAKNAASSERTFYPIAGPMLHSVST